MDPGWRGGGEPKGISGMRGKMSGENGRQGSKIYL